jgi:predicted component of type VI protein secretion system
VSEFALIEVEPRAGARHQIAPGTTIGREGCDIVLSDVMVSRRHAAFRMSEQGIAVEDLGSRNGTFVNERRLDGIQALRAGDTVRIGSTSWQLQSSAGGETVIDAPPPAPAHVAAQPRGDVPAPPPPPPPPAPPPAPPAAPAPAAPPAAALAPPSFSAAPARRIGGSAARSGAAVAASYAVVLLTAAALIVYFASR